MGALVGSFVVDAAAAVVVVVVVIGGKSCFRFWVGEGDGDRLNKFFIGSVVGNVSLICGDFSAGNDGVSSIFSCTIFYGFCFIFALFIHSLIRAVLGLLSHALRQSV